MRGYVEILESGTRDGRKNEKALNEPDEEPRGDSREEAKPWAAGLAGHQHADKRSI